MKDENIKAHLKKNVKKAVHWLIDINDTENLIVSQKS